jgi:2-dehydro-3-deoxyphosphogluconate aldolase / (4S)-4-hydroxy-2-oxoglutarate aldolase
MNHHRVVGQIVDRGILAIVRADSSEEALEVANACFEGGVIALEITFTTPGAAEAIRCLRTRYSSRQMVIGAGTVLDPETARIAILSGAEFVVAPSVSSDTARLCNRYQIPYIPGASSVKEVIEAMEVGAAIIKVFPGEVLGSAFIKAVHGPLPQAPLMPTGGVNIENVKPWIEAGSVALGVGGNLTRAGKTGDFASVTKLAREFITAVQNARTVQNARKSGSNS